MAQGRCRCAVERDVRTRRGSAQKAWRLPHGKERAGSLKQTPPLSKGGIFFPVFIQTASAPDTQNSSDFWTAMENRIEKEKSTKNKKQLSYLKSNRWKEQDADGTQGRKKVISLSRIARQHRSGKTRKV